MLYSIIYAENLLHSCYMCRHYCLAIFSEPTPTFIENMARKVPTHVGAM